MVLVALQCLLAGVCFFMQSLERGEEWEGTTPNFRDLARGFGRSICRTVRPNFKGVDLFLMTNLLICFTSTTFYIDPV